MWLPGLTLSARNFSSVSVAASGITSRAANPGIGFLPGLPGPRCSTATQPPRIWSARRVCHARAAHRLANLVQHQPRGGVTDADFLGQLHRRDALLVVAHAIDRPKPTAERGPRLVKDGPGCHRALVGAKRTLVHLACCHVPATRTTTTRALKPFGPPLPAQLLATLLLVSKRCTELLHRHHPVALRR